MPTIFPTQERTLRWRIIVVLLAVSLLPLVVAGVGGWVVFGKLLEQKALEQMRTLVQNHANAIETNLSNRIHRNQQCPLVRRLELCY